MSMVRRFENTSDQVLTVKQDGGVVSNVPPGGVLRNTWIVNLEEVRGQASVTLDLGEIEEHGYGEGRTQLRD